MKVPFPVDGLVEGLPSVEQPQRTSFSLQNVRPFDVTKEKLRGGKRPPIVKAYTNQIGGSHPVLFMTSIVTTYVTPD